MMAIVALIALLQARAKACGMFRSGSPRDLVRRLCMICGSPSHADLEKRTCCSARVITKARSRFPFCFKNAEVSCQTRSMGTTIIWLEVRAIDFLSVSRIQAAYP